MSIGSSSSGSRRRVCSVTASSPAPNGHTQASPDSLVMDALTAGQLGKFEALANEQLRADTRRALKQAIWDVEKLESVRALMRLCRADR